MPRLSAIMVLVVMAIPADVTTAVAAAQGGRVHRPAPHHAVRKLARRSRALTVRRVGRAPATRDFDPVPFAGGPIANFAKDIEEVYGHDLPLGPDPSPRLRVSRDF